MKYMKPRVVKSFRIGIEALRAVGQYNRWNTFVRKNREIEIERNLAKMRGY